MESALIYIGLFWTAALLVIVHKIAVKKIKEARIRRALQFSILIEGQDY